MFKNKNKDAFIKIITDIDNTPELFDLVYFLSDKHELIFFNH